MFPTRYLKKVYYLSLMKQNVDFDSNDMFGPSLKRRPIPHSVRTQTPLKHSACRFFIYYLNKIPLFYI